jgi:UDP-glucose 4-epimerase
MSFKLLVTGGLGYVGGRLAECLTSHPGLTLRLSTRRTGNAVPLWARGMDLAPVDVEDDRALMHALDGVHTVVHLAALNAQECTADPDHAERINVGGTQQLVEIAARQGARRIIYLSTAHVYAAPLQGVITEDSPTVNQHPYAATHRRAEEAVLAGPVPATVVRLSNGFGPPRDPGANCWMLLINDLCRQAVTERRLVLRSSGRDRRDFISLSNAAGAISHLLGLPAAVWNRQIFNVGSGKGLSVLEMTKLIAKRSEILFDFSPEIEIGEGGSDGPDITYSSQRIAATGFVPNEDAEAEIDATLSFCKKHFGA